MKTQQLIQQLSQEVPPGKSSGLCLRSPTRLIVGMVFVFIAYGIGAQFFLGLRPDIANNLVHPLFLVEVALLALLALTSVAAAIFSMYPDLYQKAWTLKLPYAVFTLLSGFLLFQVSMASKESLPQGVHGMECAVCIAAIALIPSGLIFGLLRKGASVHPLKAGAFAVLAASGLGCLTLRLAEANDSLMHLVTWHYLPTLIFSCLGAAIGKWLLKW